MFHCVQGMRYSKGSGKNKNLVRDLELKVVREENDCVTF